MQCSMRPDRHFCDNKGVARLRLAGPPIARVNCVQSSLKYGCGDIVVWRRVDTHAGCIRLFGWCEDADGPASERAVLRAWLH